MLIWFHFFVAVCDNKTEIGRCEVIVCFFFKSRHPKMHNIYFLKLLFLCTVLIVLLFVAVANAINQMDDDMGNMVASILSNAGSGSIMQGSDNNAGAEKFMNSVQGSGSDENVNALAGNEDAVLQDDSQNNRIAQRGDGNNNDDSVQNHVTNAGDSFVNFNVANTMAKTQNATGNNTVAQTDDNNNASNKFQNV